jgi:hypothetical protein
MAVHTMSAPVQLAICGAAGAVASAVAVFAVPSTRRVAEDMLDAFGVGAWFTNRR